jgi:hypothetical protein
MRILSRIISFLGLMVIIISLAIYHSDKRIPTGGWISAPAGDTSLADKIAWERIHRSEEATNHDLAIGSVGFALLVVGMVMYDVCKSVKIEGPST